MNYKFGLVMSGGGTRGATHIGVVKALEEYGLEPNIIAGCSAGALIGAFYAASIPSSEILSFFKKTSIFSHPSFTLNQPGLFNSESYIKDLVPYFRENSFESLNKKLKIYTTDLISGSLIEHTEGPLLKCIAASCAIPGIFTPVEYQGKFLSDGGILNVFPVSKIRKECKYILGVMIANPGNKTKKQLKNTHHVVDRALTLNIYSKALPEIALCDWLIEPPEIGSFNMIRKNHTDDMVEIGYQYGLKLIPDLLEKLNQE